MLNGIMETDIDSRRGENEERVDVAYDSLNDNGDIKGIPYVYRKAVHRPRFWQMSY